MQPYFADVAKYLFNNVAIGAGEDRYTFVEIEFYYYRKGKEGERGIFEGPRFNCTYPRTRRAGQFFWHYSGLDICFESKESEQYFGGILIRSLMKNDKDIMAGPMRCSDELLNSCGDKLPSLIDYEAPLEIKTIHTTRYGITADLEQDNNDIFLGYYIELNTWKRMRENVLIADKESGGYKIVPKKIVDYTARPDKRKRD